MSFHVVLDTNVLYAALKSRLGASRYLIDRVLARRVHAHVSVPLVLEYEAVLTRDANALGISPREARIVIAALLEATDRHEVYFRWPSHVRDPDDAHVLETAIAASCQHLVTFNKRDFHQAHVFNIQLLTPREYLEQVHFPSEKR